MSLVGVNLFNLLVRIFATRRAVLSFLRIFLSLDCKSSTDEISGITSLEVESIFGKSGTLILGIIGLALGVPSNTMPSMSASIVPVTSTAVGPGVRPIMPTFGPRALTDKPLISLLISENRDFFLLF